MDEVMEHPTQNRNCSAGSSGSRATPRRSLGNIFAAARTSRRPKTPSVVITDETSTMSELTSIGGKPSINGAPQVTSPATESCDDGILASIEPGSSTTAPAPLAAEPGTNVGRCCNERSRKVLCGLVVMTCVSMAWVGATHLLKITFYAVQLRSSNNSSSPDQVEAYHYSASFLNTWFVTTWTSLFLPLHLLCRLITRSSSVRTVCSELQESALGFRDKGFTFGKFLVRCALFCVLWVGTNWMYMFALRILDVTDVMALFSTNVSFVYLLSWVILHDQFVGLRIVAVILCNTGIALLAYMDGITRSPTLGGVILAAAAAAGSAVYKVLFKRMFGDATYGQVSLFFTLIGLMNALFLWPVVLALHFSGAEVVHVDSVPWIHLTMAAALSLIANLLGNFGPALTYEVFVHLGLVTAIPISASLDVSWNKVTFEGMKLAGTILTVSGFLLVLFPENWPDYLTRLLRWGSRLHHHHISSQPLPAVDLRTGYISRSHLRSPSGRVR